MICIVNEGGDADYFANLLQHYSFVAHEKAHFALYVMAQRVELKQIDQPKLGAIFVDFLSDALNYRRKFGGGKQEAIIKAIGLKNEQDYHVVDATAGLGKDAFILASIGCRVTMIERHPIIAILLSDGLKRLYSDPLMSQWAKSHLSLITDSAQAVFNKLPQKPDVIYLDPMFPQRKKSALVKKEMQIFQALIGEDIDIEQLFITARQTAIKRIVVKRPKTAEYLSNEKPNSSIMTKNHRFDIYLPF